MKFKFIDKAALIKSCIYRLFASCVTFIISLIFTGSIQTSSLISICEFFGKILCFYIFEISWKIITKYIDNKHYRDTCYKFNKEGRCIWLSGLNSAGKTSIGKELVKHIDKSILIDGDAIRNTINKDLGFTKEDIQKNIQKIAQLTKILVDQGYTVIVACISKNASDRAKAKEIIGKNSFYECYIHVDDIEWRKRLNKLHKNTLIIQTDYEKSSNIFIDVDTTDKTVQQSTKEILCKLMA